MRKLILICLCLLLLTSAVFAQSDEITEYNTHIRVDESGVRHVSAVAQIRFTDRRTSFVFPLGKEAEEIVASGGSYEIETIDGVKCVVFSSELGFAGTQSFQCSYVLPCTMTENAEGQHFSAKVPERGWEFPIAQYSLTVDFPGNITEFPLWESSYYGDEIDNYLHIQIKGGQVQAVSNTPFRDHETVSMELRFEPDSFALRHLAEQTVAMDRLVFFFLYGLCLLYWVLYLRGRMFYGKADASLRFRSSAGEIPCQLYHGMPDMGGLIAHWGSLGYVILRHKASGQFRLEKQMNMGNERPAAERRLFGSIFRSLPYVELSGAHFAAAVSAEGPVLRAHWKQRMFHRGKGNPGFMRGVAILCGLSISVMIFDIMLPAAPSRWFWLVVLTLLTLPMYWLVQAAVRYINRFGRLFYVSLGILSAGILFTLASGVELRGYMFFCLLLQCFCAFVTRYEGKRSVEGEETIEELVAFRKQMRHITGSSAEELLRIDPQYYYRALPYAELLGIDRRFVKVFAPRVTESCQWIVEDRRDKLGAMDVYKLYKELLRQLRLGNPVLARRRKFSKAASTLRVRPGTAGARELRSASATAGANRSTARRPGHTARPTTTGRRPLRTGGTTPRRSSASGRAPSRSRTTDTSNRRPSVGERSPSAGGRK